MSTIVWFRSDLRSDDNTALHNALNHAALQQQRHVAAIFYATPEQWREHDMAPVKAEFLWRNLICLRESLARIQVPLHVRVLPRFDDIAADLLTLCAELNCDALFSNREYAINEIRRDETIASQLAGRNIVWHNYDDATLLSPGALRTQQGQPYKMFTPFKRALLDLIGDSAVQCFSLNTNFLAHNTPEAWHEPPPLPAYPYASSKVPVDYWPAGESAVQARLTQFISDDIDRYKSLRDIPAAEVTSRLSPYLALGVISIRRCIEAALAVNAGQWQSGHEGVATWLNELIWREFYLHVLAQFPRVSMNRPLRIETETVHWREDEKDFEAWCRGRTGFPIVDAAMRQLEQTGWMHNRMRMVCAMFCSKYLLLDWRRGESYFMRHLIDGDLAANNGGWQWSASTGTDAAPYFRLLSPVRQMERFDTDARFCKQFLPELSALDAKILSQPGHPDLLRAGYPPPLVDLKFARERVLQAFSEKR